MTYSDCEHVRAGPSVDLGGEAGGHRCEALKVEAEEADVWEKIIFQKNSFLEMTDVYFTARAL